LGVTPTSLDFGSVKQGSQQARVVTFEARTQTEVKITAIRLEPGSAPGGSEAFVLGSKPTVVEALGRATMTVTFAPEALLQYQATLVVESDDAERPVVRIPLVGDGERPTIAVTPVCERMQQCQAVVTVTPPAIDFGMEPFNRQVMTPANQLPGVVIVNDGSVPLEVKKVAIEGRDAAAFTFARTEATPWELMPSEGRTPQLRFRPTSVMQASYEAVLVVESDDPLRPKVTVALTGTLLPNQAPSVCFNLTRVTPPPTGGGPRDYASSAQWAPLLVPPTQGYDFRATRDVRPQELVQFSAHSDPADVTKCTTDPETGRNNLRYSWKLVSIPMGARPVVLSGATTPQLSLRPVVTGDYVVELTVSDGMASTVVTGTFTSAIKQDLVVQLDWSGADGVDLDLHFVRPSATTLGDPFSGVFQFFDAPTRDGGVSRTSGDLNGYAARTAPTIAQANFDWGEPGQVDDPVLNLDNTGMATMGGDLIENISLNNPENDARCAMASCGYRIFVHAFRDARSAVAPPPCIVDGGVDCRDGESCTCSTTGLRCVAESSPIGDAGVGPGRCLQAPTPVVRIFVRGSAVPAKVIPLDTLMPPNPIFLAAPCAMWAVAEVQWPAKTAIGSLPDGGSPPPVIQTIGEGPDGRIVPRIARFGYRQMGGSLQCSPDLSLGGADWYGPQPR
jgi:hypothetical protein